MLLAVLGLSVHAVDMPDCFEISDVNSVYAPIMESVKDCVEGEWNRVTDELYEFMGECDCTMYLNERQIWLIEAKSISDYAVGYCAAHPDEIPDSGPWDPTKCDGEYDVWHLLHKLPFDFFNAYSTIINCDGTTPTSSPTNSPTASPTRTAVRESAYYVVAGNRYNPRWGNLPLFECLEESRTEASQGTATGADIAVSCCNDGVSGTEGERKFDNQCYRAQTYERAKAICGEYGYRLCTYDEMYELVTQGTGCRHDSRYNWVEDECTVSANAAAVGTAYEEHEQFGDFIPMALGVAVGAVVISVIVVAVLLRKLKRKKMGKQMDKELDGVVHVPDASTLSADGQVIATAS